MAQVNITLKVSIEEVNLLLKLLQEGEETRNSIGRQFNQDAKKHPEGSPTWERLMSEYRLMGQEVLAIQALRRGMVRGV